jgi:hypothetical protein
VDVLIDQLEAGQLSHKQALMQARKLEATTPSVHRSSRSLDPGSRSTQAKGSCWVVYAWVNDDDTQRACESSDDDYRVFRKMLESGHPPDDWDQLLSQAALAGNRPMQAFNTLNTP